MSGALYESSAQPHTSSSSRALRTAAARLRASSFCRTWATWLRAVPWLIWSSALIWRSVFPCTRRASTDCSRGERSNGCDPRGARLTGDFGVAARGSPDSIAWAISEARATSSGIERAAAFWASCCKSSEVRPALRRARSSVVSQEPSRGMTEEVVISSSALASNSRASSAQPSFNVIAISPERSSKMPQVLTGSIARPRLSRCQRAEAAVSPRSMARSARS